MLTITNYPDTEKSVRPKFTKIFVADVNDVTIINTSDVDVTKTLIQTKNLVDSSTPDSGVIGDVFGDDFVFESLTALDTPLYDDADIAML